MEHDYECTCSKGFIGKNCDSKYNKRHVIANELNYKIFKILTVVYTLLFLNGDALRVLNVIIPLRFRCFYFINSFVSNIDCPLVLSLTFKTIGLIDPESLFLD